MTTVTAPTPPPPGRSNHSVIARRYRRREAALGYLFIAPAFALFGVFSFYPFLRNFYLALYQSGSYPGSPTRFVGLSQLATDLSSSAFLQSLQATAIFVAISVPIGVLGGLFLAILAHKKVRGLAFFRTAFASTIVSSAAVGAAVFSIFLGAQYGYLPWLHISIVPSVLQNPRWALPAMALVQVWTFLGLSFIIFMAGMQSLPEEVLEAAMVDGASPWQRLWKVTVPLLSTSIYVTIVIAMIYGLNTFAQTDVLIGYESSGYVHTTTLVYLVYQEVLYYNDKGAAACFSLALFVITLIVTLVQFRLRQRSTGREF